MGILREFLISIVNNCCEGQDCWVSAEVPKLRCLSPGANSLNSKIAGRQPRCLSLGA
jgi:hypothetical protein